MKFQPDISEEDGLFYGNNLFVMKALINKGYKEKFDMIYFDGPFNSGWIFSIYNKELNEQIIDPWNEANTIKHFYNPDLYRSNYRERIEVARELLSEKGILVFQTSQKEGHYLKIILDDVFGSENFLGEVIWKFADTPLYRKSQFGLNHECLFFYAKTDNYLKKNNLFYSSVWEDVGKYENLGKEDTFYATQKPERLMERILQLTKDEGSLIGDFYCGSGTMPFIAEKMKRRWIASDNSRLAIETTVSRMAAVGVNVTVHQLVENFNETYLHGNEYTKKTEIPFSLYELQGLKKEVHNTPINIKAYEYTSEIDLAKDKNFTFQLMMPSIIHDSTGDFVETTIQRPIPLLMKDGYQLSVANSMNWIMYHIAHGQIEKDGYRFDFESLKQRVNNVHLKINTCWLKDIKEHSDHHLLIDVFGYSYKVPKQKEE